MIQKIRRIEQKLCPLLIIKGEKKTRNKSKVYKESELNNKRNNNLNDIEETNPRRGNRHDQSTRIIKTYERK